MSPRRIIGAAGKALRAALGSPPPRMQVGALCREAGTGQVLLITSRGTGRWIIPKGWPMPGRSLAEAALQEAWEEAGVRGQPDAAEIGRFGYDKEQAGFAVPIEVRVFPIRVTALADDWPEVAERTRRWFDPAEAARLVSEPRLRQLLDRLAKDAGEDGGVSGGGGAGAVPGQGPQAGTRAGGRPDATPGASATGGPQGGTLPPMMPGPARGQGGGDPGRGFAPAAGPRADDPGRGARSGH